MDNFARVAFKGTFRSYQQQILDHAKPHLQDKKIHIVAAPGSGKTILGLELIRMLNQPTLIFSPSITIREQWKERFSHYFLNEEDDVNRYVSSSLLEFKLITTATYQSLHSAIHKIIDQEEDEDGVVKVDFSQYDVVKAAKKKGILTICLDEAHHLRSEWQKSLEAFIKLLGSEVTIISLTATPPYDASPSEWEKYISLCGTIDEEISVPELVMQNTLCPHQDYIYFNYPTEEELAVIKDYRFKVNNAVNEIINSSFFHALIIDLINKFKQELEFILDNPQSFVAICTLASLTPYHVPNKLVKLITINGKLPTFTLQYGEIGLQFIFEHPEFFINHEEIKKVLTHYDLIERKKVCLVTNQQVTKTLVSSVGKLKSIEAIVKTEYQSLQDNLRMLILTDYIKKDLVKYIGMSSSLNVVSTVSVFEKIRRQSLVEKIGVLSGTLVILPASSIPKLEEMAEANDVTFNSKEINNTNYYEITFKSNNKLKVSLISELFALGYLNILIGTKSLLGEGWDSPCINSLILANFVGSFMLSNQMRGRAIRIDKNAPNKVANIWHLVTIVPNVMHPEMSSLHLMNDLISDDYETLRRRFECFMGPSYEHAQIESGIERISIIKPPYDEKGIQAINEQMLVRAIKRDDVKEQWTQANVLNTNIYEETVIPKKIIPKSANFFNWVANAILMVITYLLASILDRSGNYQPLIYFIIACISIIIIMLTIIILRFISPKGTLKTLSNCMLKTLKDLEVIESKKAKVKVESQDVANINLNVHLENASLREQNLFASLIKEMLSPIKNPRYLFIKKRFGFYSYRHSFNCPSVIDKNKTNAKTLEQHLKLCGGSYQLVYTRNEKGRKLLLKCRRKSITNINATYIGRHKKTISKYN